MDRLNIKDIYKSITDIVFNKTDEFFGIKEK